MHCATTSEGLFLSTWEWISTISLEAGRQDEPDDRLISSLLAEARLVVRRGCQVIAMFDNFTPGGLFSLADSCVRSTEITTVFAPPTCTGRGRQKAPRCPQTRAATPWRLNVKGTAASPVDGDGDTLGRGQSDTPDVFLLLLHYSVEQPRDDLCRSRAQCG